MITNHQTDYQTAKNNVLSMYESTMALTKHELVKDFIKPHQNVLNSLSNEIERVKANKFSLMIAGEAKCGKSTFINAYLGFDILPMDTKQCTSSIIEIKYGEELLLEVEYADGEKTEIKGEETIRQFLKMNAAIDDEYRDIPVPVINTDLLVKTQGNPHNYEIQVLIDTVQDANIYHLSKEDYDSKIQKYIQSKQVTWKDIVTKMVISYPFASEELKGIELIDSPGVNAAGRIGDVTEQYIKNADAIMFLKPITGASLESEDFKKFLERASNEKENTALFLVLTHVANVKKEAIQDAYNQAEKIYPQISTEQILFVDSKARMYKYEISRMPVEDVIDWANQGLDDEIIDHFLANPLRKSKDNVNSFMEEIEQLSRFEDVDYALNKFGRVAHFNRLSSILKKLEGVLKQIHAELNLIHDLLEEKISDPETFIEKISQLLEQLQDVENRMHIGIENIKDDFLGQTGKLNVETEHLKTVYEERFKHFSSRNYEELKRLSDEAIEAYSNFFIRLSIDLVHECNKTLISLTESSIDFPSDFLTVTITDEEIQKIKQEAEKYATSETITKGGTFKKAEKSTYFAQDKYTKKILEDILSRLDDIITTHTETLIKYTNGLFEKYRVQLTEQTEQLKTDLMTLRDEELTNLQNITKLECYEQLINEVESLSSIVEEEQKNVSR